MGALKVWEVGVTTNAITVNPTTIGSSESWGTPTATLTGPNVVATPTSIASAESWGTPVKTSGPLTASPTSIGSAESWGSPTAQQGLQVAPASIASQEAWGTPTAALGVVCSPASIASQEAWGQPTFTPGPRTLSPTSIPTAESWGVPTATNYFVAVPQSILSAESWGLPTLVLSLKVSPVTIPSQESWGTPWANIGTIITVDRPGIIIEPNQADLKMGPYDMPYAIRAGDTLPPLVITLTDKGQPMDLSSYGDVVVRIKYDGTDTVLVKDATVLDQNTNKGQVRVNWASGDTDIVGDHDVLVTATGIDGDRTFPGEGEGSVVFAESFA